MKRLMLLTFCAVLGWVSARADEPVAPRVNLTSQPSGATVAVDGQDRGTTPVVLFDLTPGRHHVKFRLPGYEEANRFINTTEGVFVEKNEVLVEEKGLLLIKTDPTDCDIAVDGVSVGRSPRLLTHLSSKDVHTVRLRKAGYQDQTITVKFDGRKPQVREEKLVLASGRLEISTEPAGAEITVNGIVRGKSPITVTDVPKGRATVKFKMEGFADEIRELAVNAGDVQHLAIALVGLPGTLHLASVPEGARFYVNEEARGKGPLTIPSLKPGSYVVRAELEGFGTMTKTILLENGTSASEEFRLSNTMGRLEVKSSPVGAQLVFDGRIVGTTKSSDPQAEVSDVFPIENVMEGEHTLIVRKDGYSEVTRHPKIQSSKTSQANVRLKRIFIPDTEIVTARGSYKGVLVQVTFDSVILEVSLGITRSFKRDEIRSMNAIKPE